MPVYFSHVIYHGNCYDGFGSAFAAWQTLGDSAKYIPAYYGMSLPDLPKDARVLICDFSWPRKDLLALYDRVEKLVVLDHHKTAQDELEGLDFAQFDMNRSGAVMTWNYFYGKDNAGPAPDFFLYLQDRDLWNFELPNSREVSTAMRMYPFDFHVWTDLINQIERLKSEGVVAQRLTDQMVGLMSDNSIIAEVGGKVVPIANATVFFSEVGEELCKRFPDASFAAYYLDRKEGHRQWGMRSRNGFDVSVIAKQYGGGGHPAAAGFKTGQDDLYASLVPHEGSLIPKIET